ncbi:hypothetical protein SNEBB_000856 [Seison nebaliae]|nr:hypothetical protein SNEBB_000856 [Seison nebaliae]
MLANVGCLHLNGPISEDQFPLKSIPMAPMEKQGIPQNLFSFIVRRLVRKILNEQRVQTNTPNDENFVNGITDQLVEHSRYRSLI